MLAWILCGLPLAAVVFLLSQIAGIRKGLREISRDMETQLSEDTNRMVYVSTRDRSVVRLAGQVSHHLKELRRQRLQLENGDRTLKEAVANISHDLRTPLTAICGYLDLLALEDKSADVGRYVAQISGRVEVLKALTEELFRYSVLSAAEEWQFEKTDVVQVLQETLLSFYGAFEQKGMVPQMALPEAPVWCMVDRSALARIFNNLISNGIKYSDGDFSVTAGETGEILFSNTSAALSTVDVGRLFDRFFTVDTARRSTGLGLSIAKLLCEKMGGSIEADYSQGKLHILVSFVPVSRE